MLEFSTKNSGLDRKLFQFHKMGNVQENYVRATFAAQSYD